MHIWIREDRHRHEDTKKRKPPGGRRSLIYFDVWGRILNIPAREYNSLPIGELIDHISAYRVIRGEAEEEPQEMFIPALK